MDGCWRKTEKDCKQAGGIGGSQAEEKKKEGCVGGGVSTGRKEERRGVCGCARCVMG